MASDEFDWAREMSRLHVLRPHSIKRRFGSNGPTPAQLILYNAEVSAWNKLYRHASKMQKKQLLESNAAFFARSNS